MGYGISYLLDLHLTVSLCVIVRRQQNNMVKFQFFYSNMSAELGKFG